MKRVERAAMHAALGDPWRLAIAERLTLTDATAKDLSEGLGIAPSLLSFHLRRLLQAGVVRRRVSDTDRRRSYLSLDAEAGRWVTPSEHLVDAYRRVVFVCTHNSARSVLASAYWHHRTGAPAESGGTHPARRIHPLTRVVARRARLDVSGAQPRSIAGRLRPSDMVVTVCDGAVAELVPHGGPRLHWSLPDPAPSSDPAAFDDTLTELQHRIDRLATSRTHSKEQP